MEEFKVKDYILQVADSLLLPDHREMLNKIDRRKRGKEDMGDTIIWVLHRIVVSIKDKEGKDVDTTSFLNSLRTNEVEPLLKRAMEIVMREGGIYKIDELKKK